MITAAVHAKDGRIFLRLWRVRRIPHPALQPDGMLPVAVAAAASTPAGEAFIENEVGGELSLGWAICSTFAGGVAVGGFGLGPPSRGSQELAMRDDRGHLYPRATPLQLADSVDLNWLRR